MVPFAPLLSALAEIPDPRRPQGRRYPLAHLLLFSVLAVLAGATSYRGIVTFLAVHRDRLGRVYGVRLCAGRPRSTRCATCFWRSIRRRWRPPSGAMPGTSAAPPGRMRRGAPWRWTVRRCGAASTGCTIAPRPTCSAPSPRTRR